MNNDDYCSTIGAKCERTTALREKYATAVSILELRDQDLAGVELALDHTEAFAREQLQRAEAAEAVVGGIEDAITAGPVRFSVESDGNLHVTCEPIYAPNTRYGETGTFTVHTTAADAVQSLAREQKGGA